MARLQILYLPSLPVGDVLAPRFALVVDQASEAELTETLGAQVEAFGEAIGASGTLVAPITLDIAQSQDDADPDTFAVFQFGHGEVAKFIDGKLRQAVESPPLHDRLRGGA